LLGSTCARTKIKADNGVTDREPVDIASRLRVARACLLGIKEAVADIEGFIARGSEALRSAEAAAGVYPSGKGSQGSTRGRPRKHKGIS
jgi:hypothetical protein